MRGVRIAVAGLTALLSSVLVLAGPLVLAPAQHVGAVAPDFSFSTSPALVPSFSPSVLDYAVRCTGAPTSEIDTTGADAVTIGGRTFPGPIAVAVPLVAGQGVEIGAHGATYDVRCLPADFPTYSASVTGHPQANGYLVTLGNYAVVFDADGVPVWWYRQNDGNPPGDAKFLDPATVTWSDGDTYVVRGLGGALERTVGGGDVGLNSHDLQRLPNGDYLGIEYVNTDCPAVPSQCVDLSSWGLSSTASITDCIIVELNSANQIVWQWDTAQHVDIATGNVNWRNAYPDVVHMNSIQYDGNGGIIFSARHLDAVYRIEMATGEISWKLGGTPTGQSLAVVGDDEAQLFSGQHDPRLLPDGSLTVHDNGSRAARPPRALRFTIDTGTTTATEIESVTDARVPASPYEGSVEKLPGGDWVADWGGSHFTTELNEQGQPQLTITYPDFVSYRAADVPASIESLRAGMDAMVAPFRYSSSYRFVGSDGGIFAFGDARFFGSTGAFPLNAPVVGMAATPDGGGYWLVASDGGVFTFGDARFDGSMGGSSLNAPVVGMAATPDGGGYWLVASDGGVFTFGDARFDGSMGGSSLNAPVVGMAATPDGGGYWLVGSDGGVFTFGDARFDGSMGGSSLNAPVVGMAAIPDGGGYWLVGSDGGIFTFGDARFDGSMGGSSLNAPVVGMAASPDGGGYWLVGSDGGVFACGDAPFDGSMGGSPLNAPIVAITGTFG